MAAPVVVVGELALLYVRLGYYGNWGGAGWSGGELFPSKIDRTVGVKDPLDQTFKDHDIRYENAKEQLDSGDIDRATYRERINEADKQLLRDMDQVDVNNPSHVLPEDKDKASAMRERARWFFEPRVRRYETPPGDDPCTPWGGDPLGPCIEDIPPAVSDNFTGAGNFIRRRDPLTLDLDHDGIETVGIDPNNPLLFDHDGDSVKTATGWISPDDAFLVLDRDGNGTIDDGTELFGDSTPITDAEGNTRNAVDGFEALAAEDTNVDGKVDSQDGNFTNLRLWRDLNQNGLSEAGELSTLADSGIASISVGKTENSTLLPNGNVLADLGTYTETDGSDGALGAATGHLGDVDLTSNTFYSQFTDTAPKTMIQENA